MSIIMIRYMRLFATFDISHLLCQVHGNAYLYIDRYFF